MAKSQSTEMSVVDPSTFAILAPGGGDVAALMRENLGGESLSPFDLARVKVPTGGGTTWEVPTLGGTEASKTIEGVVIHVARRRAYWSSADPSGQPPDCSSVNCETGVGRPGGACSDCPLAEYGSAKDGQGRGQACKESRLLFVVRSTDRIPIVIAVPPASLRGWKGYAIALSGHELPIWGVVTRLALEKVSNKDGIGYSQIKPTVAATLPKEAAQALKDYAASLRGLFAATTVQRSDVEG